MDRQAFSGLFRAPGETVENRRRWCTLARQNGEGVVPCLASVDDQRQVVSEGEANLGSKLGALNISGRMVVVVVKPALPHSHDPLLYGPVKQRRHPLTTLRAVVRMQTNGGPHITMRAG